MKRLLVLLWLLVAVPSYAAFVQSTGMQCADGTSTQVYSFSTLPSVGSWIFVTASIYTTVSNPSTVTDNQSNTYSKYEQQIAAAANLVVIHYGKATTSSGTFTITVSVSGTANYYCSQAMEWSAINSATPFDKSATNNGGSGSSYNTGTTAATTAANELVVVALNGAIGNPAGLSTPASAGYTSLLVQQDGSSHCCAAEHSYKTVAATGTQTGSWTSSTSAARWIGVIATFDLTVPGGAVPRLTMLGVGP